MGLFYLVYCVRISLNEQFACLSSYLFITVDSFQKGLLVDLEKDAALRHAPSAHSVVPVFDNILKGGELSFASQFHE